MTPQRARLQKFVLWTLCFPVCSALPRASWLRPQRQPLSVPANTSQLCAQTKPRVPVGAGPAEGTFPGNSGGGGWEGRGDCLIAGTRRHRLGDLAGPQGPVAVGGDRERRPGWKKSAVGEGRKQADGRDNGLLCVCVRLRLPARAAGARRSEALSGEIFVPGCESDLRSQQQGSGPGRGDTWPAPPPQPAFLSGFLLPPFLSPSHLTKE